jgi:hypothetical protein
LCLYYCLSSDELCTVDSKAYINISWYKWTESLAPQKSSYKKQHSVHLTQEINIRFGLSFSNMGT